MVEKNSHEFVECFCNKFSCGFCRGTLKLCKKCYGLNNSLTSNCCGYRLSDDKRMQIAKGKTNYYNDNWHDYK